MSDDLMQAHIAYLEDEVLKLDKRAQDVEAMIATLDGEPKKHAAREIVIHLRDEASEHRKFLALVKPK